MLQVSANSRPRLGPSSRILPLFLVAIGVLVYANSVSSPFVFDDVASIPQNPSIRHLTTALSPPPRGEAVSGRPMVNLSLALNYAVGGVSVTGYHVVNIALHLACALLLFAIVKQTIADERMALACALVWMFHPLQTEVVDYTVARTESMMALCLLLTLYAAIRGWPLVAIAACATGMACKETMVVAPLIVAMWDGCFGHGRRPAARWRLYAGLAATWVVMLALFTSAPRAHSAGFLAESDAVHPASAWSYLLNQSVLIVHYLQLIVWPSGLVLDYGFPQALSLAHVAPQMIALVTLAIAVIIALVKWPRIGFLGAWFFVTLAPSSSLVPVATEVGAERRMYLPSMAVIVLAVWLGRTLLKRHPRVASVALVALVVLCIVGTVRRNREYGSPLTLWSTNVERWPNGRARSNLAAALQVAGRNDEVVPQLRAAVADFPEARFSLGAQLVTRGDLDEGAEQLDQFVREFPTHPNVSAAREHIAHAHTLIAARLTDEAIAQAAAGQLERARSGFRRVVELLPQSGNAHRNLANVLLDARDYDGATAEAREALRLNPNDDVAREILSLATRR